MNFLSYVKFMEPIGTKKTKMELRHLWRLLHWIDYSLCKNLSSLELIKI